MKKALPLLALLLALAGVVVFTMRRAGGSGGNFPASRAAELAPGDAVFFVQVEDVDRTVARWKTSELGLIASAQAWPRWRETVMKWLDREHPRYALGARLLDDLDKINASGFFLAATDLEEKPLPKVVCGIPYRAKKADVEAVVRKLKDQLLAAWPGATSELSSHEGVEIESISSVTPLVPPAPAPPVPPPPPIPVPPPGSPSSPGTSFPAKPIPFPSVHLAFRDNWLFVATDRALLAGTLERYVREAGAARSLAEDPSFNETKPHALPGADVLAWARWDPAGWMFVDWLLPTVIAKPRGAGDEPRALLYSYALEAPTTRDRLYFHLGKPPPEAGPLDCHSAVLTRPGVQAYAALNLAAWPEKDGWLQTWLQREFLLGYNLRIRPPAPPPILDWGEFPSAFGPELAFTLQSSEKHRWPHAIAALEVRDGPKARAFAKSLLAPRLGYDLESSFGEGSWLWSKLSSNHSEMVLLTKTHLRFGSSMDALKIANEPPPVGVPTLAADSKFAAALRAANAPNGMFLYVDTARFFEDLTNTLSSSSSLTISPSPAMTGSWPPGVPFPRSNPIFTAREVVEGVPFYTIHNALQPGTLCVRSTGQGWEADSNLGMVGNTLLLLWLQYKE